MSSTEGSAVSPSYAELLSYWFRLTHKQWFGKDAALDADIRCRFGDLYAQTARETPEVLARGQLSARTPPLELLARIIVLDQLPRNMFRGSPRAFEADAVALELARLMRDAGLDKTLTREQRLFAYLPFEHSEVLANQEICVGAFEALGDPEWTRFAARHREIIARFGRFPHRNAVLGRTSTPEELAFLQEKDSAF